LFAYEKSKEKEKAGPSAMLVILKRCGAAMSLSRRRAAAIVLVSRGRSETRPVDNDDTRTLSAKTTTF